MRFVCHSQTQESSKWTRVAIGARFLFLSESAKWHLRIRVGFQELEIQPPPHSAHETLGALFAINFTFEVECRIFKAITGRNSCELPNACRICENRSSRVWEAMRL